MILITGVVTDVRGATVVFVDVRVATRPRGFELLRHFNLLLNLTNEDKSKINQ